MQLIDNINTLWGEDLKSTLKTGSRLKIAAGFFSIYAFSELKKELEKVAGLDFIFTAPTLIPDEITDHFKKEHREFYIPRLNRERSVYGAEFELQLRNQLNQRAIARECANWIRRKAKFRSNQTRSGMQSFATIEGGDKPVAYSPISGFTTVDLGYQQGDAVSNFINKFDEQEITRRYIHLFDQLWLDSDRTKDITEDLCIHIESVYKENPPDRIYFLILYNIFNEFLEDIEEEVLPNDKTGYLQSVIWTKLYNFQRDAATGIINKLEKFNGCILADSVGLGKTFTALAVVKYYELRNKSVLVLCPKKLADNWLTYNRNYKNNSLIKDRFSYHVLCHTDLQRTSGYSFGTRLDQINWSNFDLVVIDESHNFRNNDAWKDHETRYKALMNRVIKEGVKTKVLMLSATPVNNRFNDLRNQLALAYEGESEQLRARLKIERSIEDIFRSAQATFNKWSKLEPEKRTAKSILESLDFDFFELLDNVTISRSRKHIETFYDTKEIGDFPQRLKPLSFRCSLTDDTEVPGFNDIYTALSQLTLAYYAPFSYVLASRVKKYEDRYDTLVGGGRGRLKQADRERSLQTLMTTNLLKRLESSVASFRLTLKVLIDHNTVMITRIDEFERNGNQGEVREWTDWVEEIEPDEDEIPGDESAQTEGKIKIDLSDMDLPSWRYQLASDLFILQDLFDHMEMVTPDKDTKLQQIIRIIEDKLQNPINPGNRKVLVFTAFADTAEYLYQNLAGRLHQNFGIHSGKVTGPDKPKTTLKRGADFQEVLTLFSPVSKEKHLIYPKEPGELTLLIGTDCISEGQNLQDCDYVINYDIHWNPVRIIQRFGRVDRLGSKNKVIQLVNFWPDISLDEYIRLKERVENRMMIVDVSATGDDNVLTSTPNDVTYRKEQLRRLQEEVIDLEDLKTGVNITDLGLNDFRMDLLSYLKANNDLERAPNGMHAVIPARPEIGLEPGVIFVLRNRNRTINKDLQNRLHPYYLVFLDHNGSILYGHQEVKRLLDLIRTGCRGYSEPIAALFSEFNRETEDGRNMEVYSELLTKAIQSIADLKDQRDLDSLFTSIKTTALLDNFNGLEDFELIAFLVIK